MGCDEPKETSLELDLDLKSFAREEWKQIREQIHILLQAIWRFEIFSIAGLALFYSWFLSISGKYTTENAALILSSPFLFSIVILARLKIEYCILLRLAQYSNSIEGFIYTDKYITYKDIDRPGWEFFLVKYPPDLIGFWGIYRRYRHTFTTFIMISGITFLIIPIYYLYNQFPIFTPTP